VVFELSDNIYAVVQMVLEDGWTLYDPTDLWSDLPICRKRSLAARYVLEGEFADEHDRYPEGT